MVLGCNMLHFASQNHGFCKVGKMVSFFDALKNGKSTESVESEKKVMEYTQTVYSITNFSIPPMIERMVRRSFMHSSGKPMVKHL